MGNAMSVLRHERVDEIRGDTDIPDGAASAIRGHRLRQSGLIASVLLAYWALAFWWLRHAAKGVGT